MWPNVGFKDLRIELSVQSQGLISSAKAEENLHSGEMIQDTEPSTASSANSGQPQSDCSAWIQNQILLDLYQRKNCGVRKPLEAVASFCM